MDWLAYTGRVEDPENLEIVVLLADKKALGIAITSTPSVHFNKRINEFASAVKQGALPLKVDGHSVWVKSLNWRRVLIKTAPASRHWQCHTSLQTGGRPWLYVLI